MRTRQPNTRRPNTRRSRGFFEIDVLIGLIIVAALTVALAAVLGRQHRAVQKLADARAAAAAAEAVLTDLQSGKPATSFQGEPDVSVKIRSLPAEADAPPAEADAPPAGAWVEVAVTVRAGRATLVGLVPGSAARPAGGAP